MGSFTLRPPSFISRRRERREEKERVRDSVISTVSGSNSEPDGVVASIVEVVPVEQALEADPEEEIAVQNAKERQGDIANHDVEQRQKEKAVATEEAVPPRQVDMIALHSNDSSSTIISNASTRTSPIFAESQPPRSASVASTDAARPSHHRSPSDVQRDQQERLAQAWAKAEERRRRQERESRSWPEDLYIDGFGPLSAPNSYPPSRGVAGARHSLAFGNRTADGFVGFGGYSSALGGGNGSYAGSRPRQRPISYSGAGALGLGGLPIPVSNYGGGGFGAMPGAVLLGGERMLVRDDELSREDRRRSGLEQPKEGRRKSIRNWFGRLRSKTQV